MKLYDNPLSGNCYKIHLLLHLIGKDYETVPVDLLGGENRQPAFLRISPRGLIPVLDDDGHRVWDSAAILVYLARKYAPDWLPTDAGNMGEAMQWLAVAGDELLYGLAQARRILLLKREGDLEASQATGRVGLHLLDQRLQGRDWLVTDRPTIADLACYPYVALAHQGGVSLDKYANVRDWIARIQALPGYIGMPGLE